MGKCGKIALRYLRAFVGGGSAPYTIPSGTVIPAKGYYVWETNNYFNNSGDTVTLKAKDGTILDQYSNTAYDASWYRYPDGRNWSSTQDTTPTKGVPTTKEGFTPL